MHHIYIFLLFFKRKLVNQNATYFLGEYSSHEQPHTSDTEASEIILSNFILFMMQCWFNLTKSLTPETTDSSSVLSVFSKHVVGIVSASFDSSREIHKSPQSTIQHRCINNTSMAFIL